jgi:O-antigen/teichoic acid export membrane protein
MDRLRDSPSWAASGRLGGWLARYRYAVAAGDQVGLSLFNFALNFCLLRALSPGEFGTVTLWMAVSLLAITVQGALVNLPLSVQVAAAADSAAARRLEEALATVNLIVIVAVGVAVGGSSMLVEAEWAAETPLSAVAITLFVVTALYREYYRAIAFGRRDMILLLVVDGPYLLVTGGCIAAMLIWPQRLAGLTTAFFALSLGGAFSQLCIRWLLPARAARPFPPGWLKTYRSIAGDVMWLVLGGVATDLQSRGYVYVTTSLVGVAPLGAINAVGTLFRPARILMSAWGKSALPHLARLVADGRVAAFDRALATALGVAAAGSVAVYIALWVGWELIDRYLFVGKYPDAVLLLAPWALASGLNVIDYIIGVALQAAREFKYLAQTALLAAPTTAITTVGAVWSHGYTWTMFGVAIGTAAVVVLQGSRLHVIRRRMIRAASIAGAGHPEEALADGPKL